jgi:hypothetical protein
LPSFSLPNVPDDFNSFLLSTFAFNEWVALEFGWLRSSGLFYGLDFGGGHFHEESPGGYEFDYGHGDYYEVFTITIGGGINIGYTFDLSKSFHISVGGSIGFWYEDNYKLEDYRDDGPYQYYLATELVTMTFGGPFVKLRWKFIEISYRGLIGHVKNNKYNDNFTSSGSDRDKDGIYNEGLGWISQFKAGLHFEL